MIKTYQYFSNGFNCNVELTYKDGLLQRVEVENPQEEKSPEKWAKFPIREAEALDTFRSNKVPFTEIHRQITFVMFWEKFDYKVDRMEAERLWNKLDKISQSEAYDHLPAYFAHLKLNNIARKYAKTYIRQKVWVK